MANNPKRGNYLSKGKAMKTKGTEPCPYCGAKPNAAKIIWHKKDCASLNNAVRIHYNPTAEDIILEKEIIDIADKMKFTCCNEPMRRTDGPHYASMCSHHRLLTDTCDQCRANHNGVLRWRCNVCGTVRVDAPGRLQGHEASVLMNRAR